MTKEERDANMEAIEEIVFNWLATIYVQRADLRQQEMRLQYTTAETHDLSQKLSILITDLALKTTALMVKHFEQENERLRQQIGDLIRKDVL